MKELDFLADTTLKWAKGAVVEWRAYSQISEILEQREHECDVMEEATTEMKKEHPVYAAKPNDPIDVALALHLNQSDDTLLVPFSRIENGVYLFGTKKVLLKLERNKLQVKVGGGFLPIEKFLEEYEMLEKEKIENTQFEFSPEAKKVMGKWAESVIDSRETSPVRMREQLVMGSNKKTACFAIREKSPFQRSLSSFSASELKKLSKVNVIRG